MSTQVSTIRGRVRWVQARLTTTPGRLRLALAAVWLLALLFFLAVAAGVGVHRRAIQTIGKDAAPSIVAAQKIRANLADMHSNTANVLLYAPGKGAGPASDYEKRRLEVTQGILDAAGNVTYGEAEKGPLRRLLDGLGTYEAAVARAWVLHQRKDAGFLAQHRAADRIMAGTLLPAADDLDRANRDALDRGYADARRSSGWALAGVVLAGLALLGVLAATQLFLTRRTHRLLNPGLVAASALALGFLIYAVVVFSARERSLKLAKEDAFQSIHDLWRARAAAYDANGDESRWLLDRRRRADYQKDFDAKVARLINPLPQGSAYEKLVAEVQRHAKPTGFKGYLAEELGNITFAGERAAALAALQTFLAYVTIDARIRSLERADQHDAAVALCLGEKPGESNWAFARFDEALGKTIQINQDEFDAAVERSFRSLGAFDLAAPLAALGIAVLAFFGLLPRLREYAV
jgi:hypothetical protein